MRLLKRKLYIMRFFLVLYSALYTLLFIIYLPFYALRARREGRRLHLRERAGLVPQSLVAPSLRDGDSVPEGRSYDDKPRIWIHAVSVGEVNVIKPLIEALRPHARLYISTTTETGQQLGQKLYPQEPLFYFPLDWGWCCRRYLNAVQPQLVLIAETEIWPNFLFQAHKARIPVILVNGRLSDRSFARYRRIRRFLGPTLRLIRTFCMQSKQDKQRIIDLGAPADRVIRIGNLKYDYELKPDPDKQQMVQTLAAVLRPDAVSLLWMCGSTREEEEGKLVDVYVALRQDFPALRWLVAPRHPHRSEEIVSLLEARGLRPALRSKLTAGEKIEVLVLDTIGELAHLYQLADLVFIGGSLVPWGGHNIVEAANFGKPITFGPHMQNFREIAETFLEAYAAVQVSSKEELLTRSRDLLQDPSARKWLGGNARRVVRENQGAVKHTVEVVKSVMGDRPANDEHGLPRTDTD
ncbi:MAG: 3-deoxy-D-manno-octulosonic acid transferase [Acidobacteria bacterium]|nr:MAG: 3-deoxy-D-manno-octulosonic acid transferase [Acidobacteriota bacterium]